MSERSVRRKVRQSQTLLPFGVGAIFEFRGESFVGQDIWRWGARGETVRSERLAAALGVDGFRSAPAVDQSAFRPVESVGIPYARFPSWLFCQQCRRMVQWRRSMEQENRAPICGSCPGRRQLLPMRWLQICPAGHMEDVDWHWWAHSKSRVDAAAGRCEVKDRLEFQALKGSGAGGLDTLLVKCRACGRDRNLRGISSADGLKAIGVKCHGVQPWQSWTDGVDCKEIPRASQRVASNVWFPTVHTSIEVPSPTRADADSDLGLAVKNDMWFRPLLELNEDAPQFAMAAEMVATNTGTSVEFVIAMVRDERGRAAGRSTVVVATSGDLLAEEWAAFVTEPGFEDRDFVTRHVGFGPSTGHLHDLLEERVSRVVAADRLREVRALEGFNRVNPDPQQMVRVDLGRNLRWLPAIEVLGEGVFLTLEESRLAVWEEHPEVRARANEMDRRIAASFLAPRFRPRTGERLRPRYLLLHTLAHLLIRRLAFESGYPAASLRERIYARWQPDDPSPQAGLLIYTAAGDSEGTLGGLVRQAEPPRLANSLIDALSDAMWCSADPLCAEKKSTSLDGLNFSACHACALLPETSCETGNYLLDRALLVGHDGVPGFFSPAVDAWVAAAAETVADDAGV